MQTTAAASDLLVAMSASLRRRWLMIDPPRLDDLALDQWRNEKPRAMPPKMAAEEWLRPVVPRA
jgi:hypothetical protein